MPTVCNAVYAESCGRSFNLLNILDGLIQYLSDILNSLTLKQVNENLNSEDITQV
jgi:hypothetical protein